MQTAMDQKLEAG